MNKPYLLISLCLLGEPCRYDGKSLPMSEEVIERLKEKYILVPVCPEQEGGLPTPRKSSVATASTLPQNTQGARRPLFRSAESIISQSPL